MYHIRGVFTKITEKIFYRANTNWKTFSRNYFENELRLSTNFCYYNNSCQTGYLLAFKLLLSPGQLSSAKNSTAKSSYARPFWPAHNSRNLVSLMIHTNKHVLIFNCIVNCKIADQWIFPIYKINSIKCANKMLTVNSWCAVVLKIKKLYK